jgi:hypothetical protein
VLATLPQDDLNEVPAAARAAEAAGYDGLVTMENRNEPFLALGVAAVSTTRIGLATGIAERVNIELGEVRVCATQCLPLHRDAGLEHLERRPETSGDGLTRIARRLGHVYAELLSTPWAR